MHRSGQSHIILMVLILILCMHRNLVQPRADEYVVRFSDNTPSSQRASKKLLCKYPHLKYIALRRGGAGSSHTDRVHLVETFQHHFPAYWDTHRKVPPIVAISFEAQSRHTESVSHARLYTLTFTDLTSTKTP